MKLTAFAFVAFFAAIGCCAPALGIDMGLKGLDCPVPAGYRAVTDRARLPPAMRKWMEHVAMPGEYWDTSDVHPGMGVVFLWHKDRRWIMEIGTGGIVTLFRVRLFQLSADGRQIAELTDERPDGEDRCQTASIYAAR